MSLSPPPSYDTCQAPPLPTNSNLQNLSYENQNSQNGSGGNGERKGGPPSTPPAPNPMILPPSVPPGGVEGPPMIPPYPPAAAPPYYNYNVGYYTPMNGVNGGGPLGGIPGEPPFCQGLRAGNGRMTPQGGRYYGKY
uniref:Uncharacterized protein n=1 Tax=Panagrolaimus superbus TaxID=310955 RepID=A0A914YG66_9BILA